ncbi:MAG: sigma-54-dependent Fis family transcriptional regulator [Verrucomicrobia bacterium]|nr:sigma-54-dependent Fis family transcriptional regulator [Verrucomicrobiota bacterium]
MQNANLTGFSILIIEDDPLLKRQIMVYLERLGADVTGVDSLQRAQKMIADLSFDFALLDVNLPDGVGTSLLKEKSFSTNTGVIVMTAEGRIDGAVEAMRLGALDYLVKPFDPAQLPLVINRARRAKQTDRLAEHKRTDASTGSVTFLFGSSLAALESQLEKILAADRRLESELPPVLIEGETGTGKTTIARWIHHQGPRASQPLVEVNCSALPESLAESELFGHERGAFTDARTARMGLFEAANGGTLFLDELPSLSLPLQAKVLKAIEDHKIRRLGGHKEIAVDARLIAATNCDLKAVVAGGQFREDLYHRLDLFRVFIPPLRERGEDILQLAEKLLDQLSARHRLARKPLHPLGRKRLLANRWPGNVRELAHELERAIVFEESGELKFEHLGTASQQETPRTEPGDDWFNESFKFPAEGFAMEEAINRLIQHALKQTGNNVSAAARLLGVSRDYIRYRLSGQKIQSVSEQAPSA